PQLTVYPDQPETGNKIVCGDNGVVVMTLNTTYPAGTTYKWYKDNAFTGETGIIYTAIEAGSYYLEVKSGDCLAVSETVTVEKSTTSTIEPLDLSITPSDGIVASGLNAVLNIENDNDYTSPTYYWFYGEFDHFNSTASLFTPTSELEHITDVVGHYKVLVVEGSCASWSVTHTVISQNDCPLPEPQIAAYNDITGICGINGSVLLQVTNLDDYTSPPYQWEWYKDDIKVVGAESPTLEVTYGEDGTYKVAVVKDCTKASTGSIIVTQEDGDIVTPLVTKIPDANELCGTNGRIMLSFTNADAYDNPVYQWFNNGYPIEGATYLLYEVKSAGTYTIVVTDGGCIAISAEEVITLESGSTRKPTIAKNPSSNIICENGSIRLSVTNTDVFASDATYIWYNNNVEVGRGIAYNATSAETYYVQVVEGDCSSVSDRETLTTSTTEIATPVIAKYPDETEPNICGENGVAVLTLTNFTDYSAATYQWYRNEIALTGETHYTCSATEAGTYYLQIIEGGCSVVSEKIDVTKDAGSESLETPLVSAVPNQIPFNGNVNLFFDNSEDYSSNVTYSWWINKQVKVSELSPYQTNVAASYYLLVVDGECAIWSGELVVTEGCETAVPILVTVPANATEVCTPNGSVLIQLDNLSDYTNPTFQWISGDLGSETEMTGETNPTLVVTSKGTYMLRVTDATCVNYSAKISINEVTNDDLIKPLVSRTPAGVELCGDNGKVVLRFTNPEEFAGFTYQWYKDGYAVGSSYQNNNAAGYIYEVSEIGTYNVILTDGDCMSMSVDEVVEENTSNIATPLIVKTPNSNEIC
ncbi:hypothetical protein LJC73_07195, partial [Bacteroidales bacterium OttesenSCG-928-L14]|nr:hypothetical protein [Bacteroidales bacterium OttesenSCG-928-L14]